MYAVNLTNGLNTVTLKMCEQYSAWFENFEIAPIEYADKDAFAVSDASRDGIDCFDTKTGVYVGTDFARSLTYYFTAEAGNYEFEFLTDTVAGKTFAVSIDGGEAKTLTTFNTGKTSFVQRMTAGNHTATIRFDGGSKFDFKGMNRLYCKPVSSMRLDTSEMQLTVDNGYDVNLAKLKVFVTYEGETEETEITGGYTVNRGGFDSAVAGEYTFTVTLTADPGVSKTFTVTVKAAKAVVSLEVDASAVAEVDNGVSPDLSKVTVKLVYNDETKLPAVASDYTIVPPEGFDSTKAGDYVFTVKYNADETVTATFTVKVKAAEPAIPKNPAAAQLRRAEAGLAAVCWARVWRCCV